MPRFSVLFWAISMLRGDLVYMYLIPALCRSLYEQLIHEAPLEKFQERRVHLLKSQVIQLERQVWG